MDTSIITVSKLIDPPRSKMSMMIRSMSGRRKAKYPPWHAKEITMRERMCIALASIRQTRTS